MGEPSGPAPVAFSTASGIPVERIYTVAPSDSTEPMPHPGAPESLPDESLIQVAGYEFREAGADAIQELAFSISKGIGHLEAALGNGQAAGEVAPRICFCFSVHTDFFEEIAKFRAARRMWARIMRDRFGIRDQRTLRMRIRARTAACSLTREQPYNNVVRAALETLAAVLGGAQPVETLAFDEVWGPASAGAAALAERTGQVIAHESGAASAPDPLGGSYFLECLTGELDRRATELVYLIDGMGGMGSALERGFPQAEIERAAEARRRSLESGERKIVGVNAFREEE